MELARVEEPLQPEPKRRGPSFFSRLLRRGRQQVYYAGQRPETMISGAGRWRPGSTSMVFGLLAVLGLGGLASYMYMPEVREPVDDVVSMVTRQFEQRESANVVEARARSAPGFPAVNMIDGFTNTYWVGTRYENGRWLADFEFQRPSDLRQINFDSGADGEQYERLGRPFKFQLRANGELTPMYELSNTSDQQAIDIDLRDVKEVRLIVHSQHRGRDPGNRIAIRRVTFYEPR